MLDRNELEWIYSNFDIVKNNQDGIVKSFNEQMEIFGSHVSGTIVKIAEHIERLDEQMQHLTTRLDQIEGVMGLHNPTPTIIVDTTTQED